MLQSKLNRNNFRSFKPGPARSEAQMCNATPYLAKTVVIPSVRQQLYQSGRAHTNNTEFVGLIPSAGLFSLSILSYVSLNRPIKEVQPYCFFCIKKCKPSCAACGETSLISTVWDLILILVLTVPHLTCDTVFLLAQRTLEDVDVVAHEAPGK